MTPRDTFAAAIALLLLLVPVVRPGTAHAELSWPDSDLSRHVQAWFSQMNGSEAEARAFFNHHFDPKALLDVSVDLRIQRRRTLLERTGGITPLEVLSATDSTMEVRARNGHGEEPVAIITAEGAPPHRLRAVQLRLESRGPGGAGDHPVPTGPPLTDLEAVQEIRAALDAASQAGTFSGAVLLARDGLPLLRQAWGMADRDRKLPATPETRFNLASIGKIVTRVALAQLAEAGKVSLDDTLAKYLPDFPHAGEITLDMLAEHRSGVGDIFNETYRSMDHSKLRHNHDYLDLLRDQPLWFPPGKDERYSNGGYVLLGEVIAIASGLDYYDYLDRKIFGPAGMKATAALLEGGNTPGVARGYTTSGAPPGEERDNQATRPARGSAAGGSYSTLDDMLRFDRAVTEAKLCRREWAEWVIGGVRPDRSSGGAAAPDRPGFAFAGGAPGISSEWFHEGPLVMIVLANRDPETARPTVATVQGLFNRMPH